MLMQTPYFFCCLSLSLGPPCLPHHRNRGARWCARCRDIGEVYYAQRSAWIATGIVFASILPIVIFIICGVYCYRRRAKRDDPNWRLRFPRSRAGSKSSTIRHMVSDGSEADSDTLKKSRSYEKVYRTNEPLEGKPQVEFPAKKWDLDEEDVVSSEGGFSQGRSIANEEQQRIQQQQQQLAQQAQQVQQAQQQQQERQTGRRGTQRAFAQQPSQGLEEGFAQSPPDAARYPSTYYRPQASSSSNRFFGDNTGTVSPVSSESPVLTQNVGLPSPTLNNRSTEV